MMKQETKTVKCPKCDGKGKITAFGHIANGDCFACKGNGTLVVNFSELRQKLSADSVKKAEFIMNATADDFLKPFWTFAKLNAADKFCHLGGPVAAAYPELWAHWGEVGRPAFFAAQAAKREEWERDQADFDADQEYRRFHPKKS